MPSLYTTTYLFGNGNRNAPEKLWSGNSSQYVVDDMDRVYIFLDRNNASTEQGGVHGHVVLGYPRVDVTPFHTLKIEWSPSGSIGGTNQNTWIFWGVHDDPNELVLRTKSIHEHDHQPPIPSDVGVIEVFPNAQFLPRTYEMDISNLEGFKSIGFGVGVSAPGLGGAGLWISKVYLIGDKIEEPSEPEPSIKSNSNSSSTTEVSRFQSGASDDDGSSWLLWIGISIGIVVVAIIGLWVYITYFPTETETETSKT